VTSNYPDRCFAFDQFGPLSIRPCHGTCWAPRKHPVRLRATYPSGVKPSRLLPLGVWFRHAVAHG